MKSNRWLNKGLSPQNIYEFFNIYLLNSTDTKKPVQGLKAAVPHFCLLELTAPDSTTFYFSSQNTDIPAVKIYL